VAGAGGGTAGRVLGVDGCRGGWVAVALPGSTGGGTGPGPVAYTAATIAAVVAAASADGPLRAVAIDIPIGLPDTDVREADRLVRAELGPRRSSVFVTPVRAALACPSHAEAVRVNRSRAGTGISVQAYQLRDRILDVDGWVRTAGVPVVEGHPELSFAALGGAPAAYPKKTWAGTRTRLALLAAAGVVLPDDLGPAGAAAVDDLLDAAVLAWTAGRVAAGCAVGRPDPPQRFSDGWPAAIWT